MRDLDDWREQEDDRLELRAREADREDRLQDFMPSESNAFREGQVCQVDLIRGLGELVQEKAGEAFLWRRRYEQLLELVSESTAPNSGLRIHVARLRRELRDAA